MPNATTAPQITVVYNVWIVSKTLIMRDIKLSLKKHMVDVVIVGIYKRGKSKVFVKNIRVSQFKYRLTLNNQKTF